MKILITGIYGFLGSHLAEKIGRKHTVIGLYNTEKEVGLSENITCFSQLDSIDIVPDLIIMCHAAVSSGGINADKDRLFQTNVDFTKQITEKFPSARSIYISSVSVYGNSTEIIDEQSVLNPESDYALSKILGEKEARQNPNAVIVRFSSLYGNGMKENTLIPNYCNQALDTKLIQVWGNGSRFQNYIHVDDAISLIEKVIECQSKIYFPLLGVSSKEYSNKETAKIISRLTNSVIDYVMEDYSASFYFNNKATQKALNWQSEIEFETGLESYIQWKKK